MSAGPVLRVAAGLLFVLSTISPSLGEAAPATGYQPRACGFDLDDDGIVGEPDDDCNLCDGVTLDPDGDGIEEDLIYVDSDNGDDLAGDGSPGAPFRTIQFAWDQADGPGDGAEDIVCFRGIAEEEEIVPGTSGVPGVRVKPRSGSEARDWEFPSNPTMLVGWDSDDDGEYPPVDSDDIAVLDGAGNHLDTGLSRAFRFGAEHSYLEVAHFSARDYGRYYPDEVDEHGDPLDARPAGFVKFTTGSSGIGGHMFLHDLWIENVNMDIVGGSHRITFDFFIGHTILHHLAMINLKIPNTSSFLARGAAPDLPGRGRDGRDYGPIRWQNLSVSAHGKDQAPGVAGGSLLGWKLWGYMTGLEILDSEFDANLDEWNIGTLSVDFVNATQCSRDWTIRNNLLLDVREALTAQGGNGEFCAHDTVNDPPKSIPRTTDGVVFEGNLYLNHHQQVSVPVEIKGGDDPSRTIENVSIHDNLFVTLADEGFGWCIRAGAANDTGPGNPGTTVIANNTCYGRVEENSDRGAIVVGDRSRPQEGQQASVLVVNNLIAGMGDSSARNIEMARVPADLLLDYNVYDPGGGFAEPGLSAESLVAWQGASGRDANSVSCTPAFQSAIDLDLRLQPYDTCAKNAGADLGAWIDASDLDGTPRPQQSQWDVGAYEVLEPDLAEAPLRYGGSPSTPLASGTTETTISLATYQEATCRYSPVPGVAFEDMPYDLTSADGRFHQSGLTGLADGQDYEIFVRCDHDGVHNQDDFRIAFAVESPRVTRLVAHWPMDENLGTSVSDTSGNHNHALLLNGGTWVTGKVGAGIALDGQNDWLLVSDPGSAWSLDLSTSLTISAWVRPASGSGQQKIVSRDNVFEFHLGHAGAGRYSIRLNNAGGGAGSTPVVPGQWQHLAATWDGRTVRYYFNGQPDGSSPFEATLSSNNNPLGLGARSPGVHFFAGSLDEVRVYDGALTAEEVAMLHQDTTPPPDSDPPLRGDPQPANALPVGTTSAVVGLRTNEAATCRFSTDAGIAYADMNETLDSVDGLFHSVEATGLADGQAYVMFVRCEDALAQANDDDFPLRFRVLRATPEEFSPADIAGLRFYIQSTVFEDPSTRARSIATCNTQACFDAGNLASIANQYCDTIRFPEGCIRRWDDLSGYLPPGGFRPPEWIAGRNFGQDDREKPLLISDCVNGHPCARGGRGAKAPDGSPLPQNFSFEIEVGNTLALPGEFSTFHLVRPVAQESDYQYFGLNGLIHRVADNSLSYRTSSSTVRVTQGSAVTNGAWQLIEVHRDSDRALRVFVNGVDVTFNSPILGGDAAGQNYLSRFKGDAPMFGDLAASLSFDRRLDEQEILDIRSYLDGIYAYVGSVPDDTSPPRLGEGSPRGQLAAGTQQATLSVRTDETATCRYSDVPEVAFADMTDALNPAGANLHQGTIAGLEPDRAYRFFVKCEDAAGNRNSDDYEIAFYIGAPGVGVGLLAHWPFEEDGGDTALNTADPSLNAALRNGPGWTTGQHGLAMSFDGVGQHAVVSDSGSGSPLDASTGLTIAVWVRPETLPAAGTVKLLSKDNIYEFEIGHAGPRTYSVRLNNARRGLGATLVEAGEWQHLAVTWDGETVRYYRNGQLDGSAAFAGPLLANDLSVGIAARPVGSSGTGPFHGLLDELRLYERALSESEIADLARFGAHCPTTPAVDCRVPTQPRASRLKISDRGGAGDSLAWKWTRGGATTAADVGHPAAGDDFVFCVYDSVGGSPILLLEQALPGGATCNADRPCWKESARGASYRDSAASHGAIRKMTLRQGTEGRSKIVLAAGGAALEPPPLPLSVDPWLQVQLHNLANDRCWGATFTNVTVKGGSMLSAASD